MLLRACSSLQKDHFFFRRTFHFCLSEEYSHYVFTTCICACQKESHRVSHKCFLFDDTTKYRLSFFSSIPIWIRWLATNFFLKFASMSIPSTSVFGSIDLTIIHLEHKATMVSLMNNIFKSIFIIKSLAIQKLDMGTFCRNPIEINHFQQN